MRVGDLMSKPAVQVHQRDDLEQAVRTMLQHDVGCLVVVDDDGRAVGILTESDFEAKPGLAPFSMFSMPKVFGRYVDTDGIERIYQEARAVPVAKVMQAKPWMLGEDATMEDAARVMVENGVRHVPIVRDGRPVGMIARRELVKLLARS